MRRESRKKPVLTSPWKIGMLVALLLVVICIGTGYYMVRVYDVEVQWLSFGGGRWHIDSFMFFRDMYILAAAVAAISLIGYFLVASAVRRYKFYLDSGQDYRKMISLADSIDDLTNPAQIARLSDYPELQNVLRNYGDQIREFSQELEQREKEHRSIDLEMEIESLLSGETVREGAVEGKWWTPLFKKLEKYTKDNREVIADIEERVEQIRKIFCSVVLSNGKMLEAVGGASEDIVGIMRAIGELNSIADEVGASAMLGAANPSGSENEGLTSTVARMEDSLRRLERGGQTLGEFSEENNALALSIALMAAKGGAGDTDLTRFAEKARKTAERFKKLGADVNAIAADIAGGYRAVRRRCGLGGSCGEAEGADLQQDLSEISRRIEQHSKFLHQKITILENELEDVKELLQQGISRIEISDTAHADGEKDGDRSEYHGDASIVNFGVRSNDVSDEESDLVIDHGKLWEDESFCDESDIQENAFGDQAATAPPDEAAADVREPFARKDADETAMTDESGRMVSGGEDARDMTVDGRDGVSPDQESEPAEAAKGDGWMQEMPAQRWLKVDVEGSEPEQDVDVEVTRERIATGADARVEERTEPGDGSEDREDSPGAGDLEGRAEDGEPVYDLFELGAVEYVEETKRL